MKLGPRQLAEPWEAHRRVSLALGLDPVPDLYLSAYPQAGAMAIGEHDPIVVVHSRLLEQLDAGEREVVLAHEAAHVRCAHVLYADGLRVIARLTGSTLARTLPAGVPLRAIQLALLEWSRAAELTCDRISALVVGDPLVVCRTLLTVAGGVPGGRLDLDAFLAQAAEYDERGSGIGGRMSRLGLEIGGTHPLPVLRARELMEWVRAGDFERARDGVRPTEQAGPGGAREDARAAAEHYRERFTETFRGLAGDVEEATRGVGEWVQRRTSRP